MCFRLVSFFAMVKILYFLLFHPSFVCGPCICVQREYDSVIQAGVESQYEASMLPHKQAWGASEEHTIRSVRSGVVFELECWCEQELSDAGERTSR